MPQQHCCLSFISCFCFTAFIMKTDTIRMHLKKNKAKTKTGYQCHCKATVKTLRSNSLYWAELKFTYYILREKPVTFNGLDIESTSVWACRCNIQTQEASHPLLLSQSVAQHFQRSDLQLNGGYIWQIILFLHSHTVTLCSGGSDFWVNKCVGIHFRKVKYPGDVLFCDYGNSCVTSSTWLLSLHSCLGLLGKVMYF